MATENQVVSSQVSQEIEGLLDSQKQIREQLRKVIVGQEEVIDQVLIAIYVGGHCLITGCPGWPRRCSSAPSLRSWASRSGASSSRPT